MVKINLLLECYFEASELPVVVVLVHKLSSLWLDALNIASADREVVAVGDVNLLWQL